MEAHVTTNKVYHINNDPEDAPPSNVWPGHSSVTVETTDGQISRLSILAGDSVFDTHIPPEHGEATVLFIIRALARIHCRIEAEREEVHCADQGTD